MAAMEKAVCAAADPAGIGGDPAIGIVVWISVRAQFISRDALLTVAGSADSPAPVDRFS